MNKLSYYKENDTEFYSIIEDLISNSTVREMINFNQHADTTCFDHCINVSFYSYLICKKFGLDYISVARARNAT